ncbi:MAG: redox-sensing transcriptional repressor Rex, partial [Mailhella sp.]
MNQTPKYEHIPRATIQRLATYLQVLEAMDKDGVQVISSEPLSRACDVNASQVRKDLAYFGEFGVRGVGYYVSYLLEVIKACLNANREWRAALVGVGNMGRALLNYQEF